MIDQADKKTIDMLGGLPTHIEAVPDFEPVQALTDQQLIQGGLAPVQSWMRTESSKNALRVMKSKKKKESEGIRQINVQAPVAIHDTLKALAKADEETVSVVASILDKRLTGWRRWLVFRLIGS